MARSNAPVILFVAILVINRNSQSAYGQKDTDKRVLVDLPAFPEPFQNDKLPPRTEEVDKEKCYNMMGCFEEIPITIPPQDPMKIKPTFRIHHGDSEAVVEFDFYENCLKSKPEECERFPFNLQALLDSPFSPSRRTIIIIGGYLSKNPSSWESRIKDIWTQLDDLNVIFVCWVGGNRGLYQTAAHNTRPVARQLTVLLYYLAKLKSGPDLDLDLNDDSYTEKFYLIGHSLGAHIAGFVGQDLNGRLGRITGLDPAGPTFDVLNHRFRLDRNDAQLVDILHTNAGGRVFFTTQQQYGSGLASGHIDLWANNGIHQPGCSNDMLGCSHKRANKFYEAFLNHQLAMQNYLRGAKDVSQLYRLSAYAGDSYDEFHNGTTLVRRCPITTLDDDDLKMPDINECSIPVDYAGWFDTFKNELETKHGVDFRRISNSSSTPVPRNYYFYTTAETNDQLDHYLIRIRVSKLVYGDNRKPLKEMASLFNRGGCDIGFDIDMSNGIATSSTIKRYILQDRLDHLEIVFPFLSPNIITKFEIARLDSANYFVKQKDGKDVLDPEDLESVRESVAKIFPASIAVRGFSNGEQPSTATGKKSKNGILNKISNFFSFASSKKSAGDDNENSMSSNNSDVDCQLTIESFTIQPFRRLNRHLSAVYMRDCDSQDPKRPVNIILLGENEPSPKTDLLNGAAESAACRNLDKEFVPQPRLSLRTIIIGPVIDPSLISPENDFSVSPLDEFTTEESREYETNSEAPATMIPNENPILFDGHDESEVPPRPPVPREKEDPDQESIRSQATFWLILTLLLLLCMLVIILISMLIMQRRPLIMNKSAFVMNNPNHASSFPPEIKFMS